MDGRSWRRQRPKSKAIPQHLTLAPSPMPPPPITDMGLGEIVVIENKEVESEGIGREGMFFVAWVMY